MDRCGNCNSLFGKCQHCGADSCHECGGKVGFCQQEPRACKKNRLAHERARLRTCLSRFIAEPTVGNQFIVEAQMNTYGKVHNE
jgi:hypothetical protein